MVQYPRESNWIGSLKTFSVLKTTKIFIQHALRLQGRKTCGWIMLNMSLNLLEEYDSIKHRKNNLKLLWALIAHEGCLPVTAYSPFSPRNIRCCSGEQKAMRHTWHARAHMVEHGIQQSRRTTQHIQLREMLWDYALSSNQSEFPSRKQMKNHCGQQAEPLHPLTSYQSTQRSHITHLALEFPIQHGNFVQSSCLSSAKRSPGGDRSKTGRLGVANFFEGWFGQSMQL